MRPADRRREQAPTMPISTENITLQDIPENEIVEDYTQTTGQEMIIYTMDEQGIMFPLAPQATVRDLLPQVIQDVGLSHEADEIFALWMMSPLLEIQLKPHHSPFRISLQWEDLLIKFTNANEEEIARDQPVLMLRRHAMLSRGREKYIEDQRILELLYYEAERNILQERCPVEIADVHYLAGLSACIKFGAYDANVTSRFYREHLDEVYPASVAVEKRVVEMVAAKHRDASEKFGGSTQEQKWELQKVYLRQCWELPYYGAAIFHGQTETPATTTLSRLSNYGDTQVYVAINREGVFVLDKTKVTLLLGLLYNEFSWEYAEPTEMNNRNCLPCLFLNFHDDDGNDNGKGKTNLLQVFSRQAIMMDALIKASKSALNNANMASSTSSQDGVDSPDCGGSRHELAAFSAKLKSRDKSSCMANKFKRLSLATFNAQGRMISTTVEERPCCQDVCPCVTTKG